jgi:hypothetical protein
MLSRENGKKTGVGKELFFILPPASEKSKRLSAKIFKRFKAGIS